jgi:hypothetical protein
VIKNYKVDITLDTNLKYLEISTKLFQYISKCQQ